MTPQETPTNLDNLDLKEIRSRVEAEANRVAELGNWPDYMKESAAESLTTRIPTADKTAPGFDAGLACALNLIPEDKQELSAALHGAYTPERITQIRKELESLDPDSETAWWLAASNICDEDNPVNEEEFKKQLEAFQKLTDNPKERLVAANRGYTELLTEFSTNNEYGIPYGEKDGCIQATYVAGYPFGTPWHEKYGIFFIGTPHESLGLEDFEWSDEKDEQGRPTSGPVFGSKQFVKCANKEEFKRALEVVKKKLPIEN